MLERQKAIVEAELNEFEFSVFGFYKSQNETGASFDNVQLRITDVSDCFEINNAEKEAAFIKFGSSQPLKIKEFPEV